MNSMFLLEENNGEEEDAPMLVEEAEEDGEPTIFHQPGKEPIADDVQNVVAPPKHNHSRVHHI